MRRAILILLSMLMMTIGASGQNRHHQNSHGNRHGYEQRDQHGRREDRGLHSDRGHHDDRSHRDNHGHGNNRHHDQNMSRGHGNSHGHGHSGGHGPGPGNNHLGHRHEIHCTLDRQDLWNGCHVRINLGRVSILTRGGDRLVWADEVILLPTGHYLTRNGHFWYVLTEYGERLGNVWGDFVELLSNGLFHCRRAGIDFYYDQYGHERW